MLLVSKFVRAQQYDCTFKPPVLKIDFGNASSTSAVNVGDLKEYEEDDGTCPNDGYYSIVSHTSDCYFGNWITLNEDHTRRCRRENDDYKCSNNPRNIL